MYFGSSTCNGEEIYVLSYTPFSLAVVQKFFIKADI